MIDDDGLAPPLVPLSGRRPTPHHELTHRVQREVVTRRADFLTRRLILGVLRNA
jgi:hypothetical protein